MTNYMLRKLKKEIKNSNTPESRLVELMNMDLALAYAVAEFGSISSNLIEELLGSTDNYLRDALSRNPNLSVKHLQHLCSDEFLPARYMALRRLLHSKSDEVSHQWLQDFMTTCPDPLMVKQIKFYLVTDAPSTSSILQTLLLDADEDVRRMARQRLEG